MEQTPIAPELAGTRLKNGSSFQESSEYCDSYQGHGAMMCCCFVVLLFFNVSPPPTITHIHLFELVWGPGSSSNSTRCCFSLGVMDVLHLFHINAPLTPRVPPHSWGVPCSIRSQNSCTASVGGVTQHRHLEAAKPGPARPAGCWICSEDHFSGFVLWSKPEKSLRPNVFISGDKVHGV